MAWPVTINGNTYTLAQFEGYGYLTALSSITNDIGAVAGQLNSVSATFTGELDAYKVTVNASLASMSTSLDNRMDAVEADVAAGLAAVDAQSDSINQQIADHDTHLETTLGQWSVSYNNRFLALETGLASATAPISGYLTEAAGYAAAAEAAALNLGAARDAAVAAAQSAVAAGGLASLSAAARAFVMATDVLDVFWYDTTRDTDNGQWRKQATHPSWCTEPLNTATRGPRREFPSRALIVSRGTGTSNGIVTIYDGDDPSLPMWMVFTVNTGGGWGNTNVLFGQGGLSLYALNGILCVGNTQTNYSYATVIDFIRDTSISAGSTNYGGHYKGNIAERNAAKGFVGNAITGANPIVLGSGLVNDIAMTVLAGTPKNPQRFNLPNPTIAFGGATATSILHWDGRVTTSAAAAQRRVRFGEDGSLYMLRSTEMAIYRVSQSAYQIANWSIGTALYYRSNHSNGALSVNIPNLYNANSSMVKLKGRLAVSGQDGLAIIREQTGHLLNEMAACITERYNTGYLPGPVKLALSESTADLTTAVSDERTANLVTNGDFAGGTTGWTTTGTVTNGVITLPAAGNGVVNLSQALPATVGGGRMYELTYRITAISGSGSFYLAGNAGVMRSAAGTYSEMIPGGNGAPALEFGGRGGSGYTSVSIDDIVLREVIGPTNYVTNGATLADTTGWTLAFTGTISAVGGALRVNPTGGGSSPRAYQVVSGLVPGRQYQARALVTALVGNTPALYVTNSTSTATTYGFGTQNTAGRQITADFVAPAGGSVYLLLIAQSSTAGNYADFDEIEIREKVELITNGGFGSDTVRTLGSELVLNGTFDSAANWTLTSAGGTSTATIGSGVLNLTGDGTNQARADQQITLEAESVYQISFDLNGALAVGVTVGTTQGSSGNGTWTTPAATGTYTYTFHTGAATTHWLRLFGSAAGSRTVDNVSIKKISPNGGWIVASGMGTIVRSSQWLEITGDGISASFVEQTVAVEAGRQYALELTTLNNAAVTVRVGDNHAGWNHVSLSSLGLPFTSYVFVPTGSSVVIRLERSTATVAQIDDISLRPKPIADRTGFNYSPFRQPRVVGSIPRIAVGTGSEMAWINAQTYSPANYLVMPDAPDILGNDFTFAWWSRSGWSDQYFGTNGINTFPNVADADGWSLNVQGPSGSKVMRLTTVSGGVVTTVNMSFNQVADDGTGVAFFAIRKRGTVLDFFRDGVKIGTATVAATFPASTGQFRLGNIYFAMFRFSLYAATDDQIMEMFTHERPLLQPGARCLLPDHDVRSLSADQETDDLVVGTINGTAVMTGLTVTEVIKTAGSKNKVRNSRFLGTLAGTPGTLPSGWTMSNMRGLSSQIVGSGITSDGMPYMDVRLFGTPTSTGVVPLNAQGTTAALGQVWTSSVYAAFVGGSLTNVGSMQVAIQEETSASAYLKAWTTNTTMTGTLVRHTRSATLDGAGVGIARFYAGPNVTSGLALDVTIRFAAPQMELAAAASVYEDGLSGSDVVKLVSSRGGHRAIATANGIDAFLPSVAQREAILRSASNDKPSTTVTIFDGVTTDATATDLARLRIPEGKAYRYVATVSAAQYLLPAAGGRAAYRLEGNVSRDPGGNVTLGVTITTVLNESTASMDCTAQVDTTNQLFAIRCTGISATRLLWLVRVELMEIGYAAAA